MGTVASRILDIPPENWAGRSGYRELIVLVYILTPSDLLGEGSVGW
jgi:hypothetical protein